MLFNGEIINTVMHISDDIFSKALVIRNVTVS